MDNLDLRVLADALSWRQAGHDVTLVTFLETWGNAPRPPGSLLALRDDGRFTGSGSGGAVVDDIVLRTRAALGLAPPGVLPSEIVHGLDHDEAIRGGFGCGGNLRVVREAVGDAAWIEDLLGRVAAHRHVRRTLTLATGAVQLTDAPAGPAGKPRHVYDGLTLSNCFGPAWRLVVVGAGELGQAVAALARQIDFEVVVCDPRPGHAGTALAPGVVRVPGLPDEALQALQPDAHTAVVALTHEPELDDLGLVEALRSPAFYVGALGSRRSQEQRRRRMAERFGLDEAAFARLFGPAGLKLGARTPGEIALSIVAEVLQARNGLAVPAAAPASLATVAA